MQEYQAIYLSCLTYLYILAVVAFHLSQLSIFAIHFIAVLANYHKGDKNMSVIPPLLFVQHSDDKITMMLNKIHPFKRVSIFSFIFLVQCKNTIMDEILTFLFVGTATARRSRSVCSSSPVSSPHWAHLTTLVSLLFCFLQRKIPDLNVLSLL